MYDIHIIIGLVAGWFLFIFIVMLITIHWLRKEKKAYRDFLTDMHELENSTWKYDVTETTITSGSPVGKE